MVTVTNTPAGYVALADWRLRLSREWLKRAAVSPVAEGVAVEFAAGLSDPPSLLPRHFNQRTERYED